MLHDAVADALLVGLIFFGAGAIKGVLGMGLPTLAMGLLGLLMPVASGASLLTAPSLVTNVWQSVGPGLLAVLRRLGLMQIGIAAGVALAPGLFPHGQEAFGRALLGGCLLAYGALGLAGWRLLPPPPRWQQPVGLLVGVATGILTGLTGVFVLPAVPYLQSLGFGKDALAQALGLCFTTSTLALALLLALQGHLNLRSSLASLLVVIPAVLGMLLGQRIRRAMSEALFRRCFQAGLLLLGGWLLLS